MKREQIIEIINALLFALCGGFCDAYTLIYRGGLYSNMQTGNLVKFFISLADGAFEIKYLSPILFFLVGIFIAILLIKNGNHRKLTVSIILAITLANGFIPTTPVWDIVSISSLSFIGAMQFEAFSECLNVKYTNTMCTNNMRLLVENATTINTKEGKYKTLFFLSVIVCFSLGALLSALLGKVMGSYTISFLAIIYLIILIFIHLSFKKKQTV